MNERPVDVASLVNAAAAMIRIGGVLTVGDVAALRRMNPRAPAAAFFKVEGSLLDEHLPGDANGRIEAETRWAAIVGGLAHLGDLHVPGRRIGRALAEVGYLEPRFVRLIRGDSDRLLDELPMLARFCAAKGVQVDWSGAAHLVLSAGRTDEERVRRHVARDYYGARAHDEGRRDNEREES